MSKTLSDLMRAHLQLESTSLALCWIITKKNGAQIFGTDHDLDIVITIGSLAGRYVAGANVTGSDVASSSDMSVDNAEVDGSFTDSILIPDLTENDVRAGLFNNAPVSLFFVNWASPDNGQVFMRSGFLGQLTWDSNQVYKTELRGLTQLMSQTCVDTYSVPCNVRKFGDFRCKVDVAGTLTHVEIATAIVSRRQFTISLTGFTSPAAKMFNTGILVGVTGANAGYTRQIQDDAAGGTQGMIKLFEAFPNDIVSGDTFNLSPGCDRTLTMCKFYGSVPNYRGYGIFIPGIDAMMLGPVGTGVPQP